ncbi:MAG: hypothetical protein J1F07_08710 [Muribaculaceae bacterium]|nr:hypothetical protein [Muribaculaceae bacterium]
MKKLLILLSLICACQIANAQISIPRQEIPYNVRYHWGLIDVMIARGIVTIEGNGTNFYGTLDGTSIPWEGHIICVSDTLNANMYVEGGRISESVVYQNGWYRHPSVSDFRGPSYNPADPAIYKSIAGQGTYDASNNSMEAITITSDMIGMYYIAKVVDFSLLKPGNQIVVPIDGPYSRQLVITYQGQGTYEVNGDTYRTYDCSFEYGYGADMSGYPVQCKIGVADRIPVFLGASLPVGEVEMLYDPY